MIFTDLDGTLLDHDTYEWDEANQAISCCRRQEIPLILVSSKTSAEMEVLRRQLSVSDPFISENGGGIFIPQESFEKLKEHLSGATFHDGLWRLSLGIPYPTLVKALQEIRVELGLPLKGFSEMSIEEISHLTGLEYEACRLAAKREFDEPFVIEGECSPQVEALAEAGVKRGLMVTLGGRFYHLQGKNDKGLAMATIISWYEGLYGEVISVALGDSPNDFSMLERADYPFLVRSDRDFLELKTRIPRLTVTQEKGPKGWNSAVMALLNERYHLEKRNAKQFSE